MEYSPPAEKNMIYDAIHNGNGAITKSWFDDAGAVINLKENAINISNTRPIADNILAMIISPRLERRSTETTDANAVSIAPKYIFESSQPGVHQHKLPPLVRIVLVAIDERSAQQLEATSGSSGAPPFGTDINAAISSQESAANLNNAIDALILTLKAKRVNYRVFSATVQIRASKWNT